MKTNTLAVNEVAKKSTKLSSVVEISDNSKTGPMSATYTGYQTCPDSCELKPVIGPNGEFKSAPCYASCDLVGMQMHRLTTASVNVPLIQIQKAETDAIKKLSGRQVLRLKVGGDTPNKEYAEGLAEACSVYSRKHRQPAYGYTHNWRNIPRESFGGISILASCDNVADIADAKAQGYATATVVSHFPNGNKAFKLDGNTVIPCPEQCSTREIEEGLRPKEQHIQCIDCQLCAKDQMLIARGLTVGFEAHGRKSQDLKATLRTKGV